MATSLGDLVVRIGADVSGLKTGVVDATKSVDSFSSFVATSTKVVGAFALAAATTGAAITIGLVKSSLETIDAQSKLSRQLDGSIGGLQALQLAAELAGISSEQLTASAQSLNIRLGEAARTASGPTYEALRRLGLTAQELSKMDIDQRFITIAEKADKLGLSSQATADLMRQLGIRGKEMTMLMEGGGKAIKDAADDVKDLGLEIGGNTGLQVEKFNDQMTRLGKIATGVGNQLTAELAAPLAVVANELLGLAKSAGGFGPVIQQGTQLGIKGFALLQIEVHNFRVDLDKAIGEMLDLFDNVAGFIPRTIEKMSGGMITASSLGFEAINKDWGKLKEKLGEAPNAEALIEYYNRMIGLEKLRTAFEAEETAKRNAARTNNDKVLTEEDQKKFEDKLLALQTALGNENDALRFAQQKRLKDLAEIEKSGVITTAQAATLRAEILKKTQDDTQDYVKNSLMRGLLTQEEELALSHERQLKAIDEFGEAHIDKTAEVAAMRLRLEQVTSQRLLEMTARNYSSLAGIIDQSMGAISDVVGQGAEDQFNIFKAISMATALVKGFEAAVSAYAAGSAVGGPVLGATFAAIAAAGTAAIIAKLAGVTPTSKGSPTVGGGGGYYGGGGGGGTNSTITVQGVDQDQLYTGRSVRGLIENINDEIKDGAQVNAA